MRVNWCAFFFCASFCVSKEKNLQKLCQKYTLLPPICHTKSYLLTQNKKAMKKGHLDADLIPWKSQDSMHVPCTICIQNIKLRGFEFLDLLLLVKGFLWTLGSWLLIIGNTNTTVSMDEECLEFDVFWVTCNGNVFSKSVKPKWMAS
jgi:hypothetical protein